MLARVRRIWSFCLRPFKVVLYPVIGLLVRKLSVRFKDDIVPLEKLEAAQVRLDAFRWDHVAMARRLAALEDHVEKLLRQQEESSQRPEDPSGAAVVPFAPAEVPRAASGAGEPSPRRQRIA